MPKKPASAQKYLEIAQIRDGVVILKNGIMKAVLMVSSINFALKSTQEQEAIIYSYQNFLNSLDFPVQIVINSRILNINEYLKMLAQKERGQTNELLRTQTAEYREFVKGLVEMANIMNKTFYIIIPFAPVAAKKGGFLDKITGSFKPSRVAEAKKEEFEKYKNQLWQRVEMIKSSLERIGLRVAPLNTQELIELYYTLYNPGKEKEKTPAEISQLGITQSP
ncbi:MAG TPA: hypothetical protein ENI16_00830 [Candidatus Portnoybacteria bacterium]|nr:hypothetical protein [Candidatus Portnoybacteria bacterium]